MKSALPRPDSRMGTRDELPESADSTARARGHRDHGVKLRPRTSSENRVIYRHHDRADRRASERLLREGAERGRCGPVAGRATRPSRTKATDPWHRVSRGALDPRDLLRSIRWHGVCRVRCPAAAHLLLDLSDRGRIAKSVPHAFWRRCYLPRPSLDEAMARTHGPRVTRRCGGERLRHRTETNQNASG